MNNKTKNKANPSTHTINRTGGLYGQVTRWGIYDVRYISPTIVAAMGQGEDTYQC